MGSGKGPASNSGAFVAAVCDKLKVPMPPPVAGNLLPGYQHDWLINEGRDKGWVEIGAMEAQVLANQGWVVVAAWKDGAAGDPSAGQTAIVRPSRKLAGEIAPNGPRVAEAGLPSGGEDPRPQHACALPVPVGCFHERHIAQRGRHGRIQARIAQQLRQDGGRHQDLAGLERAIEQVYIVTGVAPQERDPCAGVGGNHLSALSCDSVREKRTRPRRLRSRA